jgi:hypothetical protein
VSKYNVLIEEKRTYNCHVEVEAGSEQEARERAFGLAEDMLEFQYSDLYIEGIELLEEENE